MSGVNGCVAGRLIGESLGLLCGSIGVGAFRPILGWLMMSVLLVGSSIWVFEGGIGAIGAISLRFLHELAYIDAVFLSEAHQNGTMF